MTLTAEEFANGQAKYWTCADDWHKARKWARGSRWRYATQMVQMDVRSKASHLRLIRAHAATGCDCWLNSLEYLCCLS